ncbi:hypothetical protein ACM55M_04595 [Flavobacterium sp. ZT3R25]|uniref:hypothetical protein n=1 Tax=Flavobacterium galactosi TaxID=3398735 RepID=UPI003A846478
MKKTLLFLILGLSLTTYSQDIEKMDKKELRIALKNSNASKDSVISINSNKDKEIAILNQNLIATKDSIKTQKVKITSLLSLKKQSYENSKMLTEKIIMLKDSIVFLNTSIPFINTAIDFEKETSVEDGCSCSFAESKQKYDNGETLYISDLGNNCTISINNKNIHLKNSTPDIIEEAKFSNIVYIHKKKVVKSNDEYETTWFTAEMVVKNKKNGKK